MTDPDAPDSDRNPVTSLPAGTRRCPICGRRSVARHQPFCSGRCADIDLGRWLKEAYRVETGEPVAEGDEAIEQ
jgi:endogenous inhibitor of DNA gyrase (YacG/DUF329 family)